MKVCKIPNCNLAHSAKGYCNKHYLKWYIHGDPLWVKPRQFNDHYVKGDTAYLILKNRQRQEVAQCYIDAIDLSRTLLHSWCMSVAGYPVARIEGKVVRLHRFLLGNPSQPIDHINRQKLDNRRSNLRLCTPRQNSQNQAGQNKTSSYKGVSYCPAKKWRKAKWAVYAKFPNSNKRFWGYYDTEKRAAEAYNDASRLYGDEFSFINKL